MWIYIILAIVLLYALYKERQALGCGNFFEGKDCDNINGKAVKGTTPYPNDSSEELFDKIELAAGYQERFVKWRLFLIVSFLATMLIWFIIYKRFPTEWELITAMLILFFAMSSASGFYKFHLYNYVKRNINESVEILRERF